MQCTTCTLIPICKIHEFIYANKSLANLSVDSCKVFSNKHVSEDPVQEVSVTQTRDIFQVANRIRDLNKTDVPALEQQRCPTCNASSPTSNFHNCHACKKSECAECMVKDSAANVYYCEECWDHL